VALLTSSRQGRTLCVLLIAGLLALLASHAGRAAAASVSLAELPNAAQKLTAYDGYIVFSEDEPSTRAWHLMVWHNGSIRRLPAPARDMPFDANAGATANGVPAIVYSQCALDPTLPTTSELQSSEYLREPDWARARGCHIYELTLPSGSPKLVKGIYAARASDSTPAISNGNIAFARLNAGSHVAKVYLWQHASHRLIRLGAGPGPCPDGAGRPPCQPSTRIVPSAWVGGMSLGKRALAYEWTVETNGAGFGEGAHPEIRVDPLRAGRQSAPSLVVEESFASGTCGYAEGRSPNTVATGVLYSSIEGDCGTAGGGPEEVRSSFDSYSEENRTWRSAQASVGLIAAVAVDHSSIYWISDVPKPASAVAGSSECRRGYVACFEPVFTYVQDCAPAHGICTLMRTSHLSFGGRERRHPGSLG
jgi:hypothetical protein